MLNTTWLFRLEGGGPQTYHPLFVWCAVHLQWLYCFIKLAKLKLKLRPFKTEENGIKTHSIAAISNGILICVSVFILAN